MNLVAHQLLSFNNPQWQIGNHMGEIVKGKKYLDFEPEIQKGILLHRLIDSYTDEHEIVHRSTSYLHKDYGKYSPIIVDIFYDFLLIKNWHLFSDEIFEDFIKNSYKTLENGLELYPHKLKIMTKAMIKYNWFAEYGRYEGIEKTLKALSQRTKFQNEMYSAVKDLYMNEDKFEEDFLAFFPELKKECKKFLELN